LNCIVLCSGFSMGNVGTHSADKNGPCGLWLAGLFFCLMFQALLSTPRSQLSRGVQSFFESGRRTSKHPSPNLGHPTANCPTATAQQRRYFYREILTAHRLVRLFPRSLSGTPAASNPALAALASQARVAFSQKRLPEAHTGAERGSDGKSHRSPRSFPLSRACRRAVTRSPSSSHRAWSICINEAARTQHPPVTFWSFQQPRSRF
jgi:hypothetical protein